MADISFHRIAHDSNGNPRYVVHFLKLLTPDERAASASLTNKYAIACKRANQIGGRKFHNKQYGGGIVFQSYNTDETARQIEQLVASVTGGHL